MTSEPTPDRILQVGFGFWASKALLSAVEVGVFTEVGGGCTGSELIERLGLVPRAGLDLLDALVALGFLLREGDGPGATYRNPPASATFLDRHSPRYLGAALEMASGRLFHAWAGLTGALRTGRPQAFFDDLYTDPEQATDFLQAMAAVSSPSFHALAAGFDFTPYRTVLDVGGGSGLLSTILATRFPHLHCTTLDLPAVEPLARRAVGESGVADRITVVSGDFFAAPLPSADVVTMSLILHDWNLDRKLALVRAAHAALPSGGAFIVVENLIDDRRRVNASGLLSSLNMLIETGDGFDFTAAELRDWCRDAGFARVETFPLAGTVSAAIAYKDA
jgi:predicted O-methyltransferase YrrM